MLITEEYRELNAQLHKRNKHYGTSGREFAPQIRDLAEALKTTDILDYGCGKGTLAMNLPYEIHQYDPAIPEHTTPPEPADMVVCTDTLEHIEPDCLEEVLDDLQRLTKLVLFCTVATIPAMKHLPDGRNAHLTVQPDTWWLPKLMARFKLRHLNGMDGRFQVVMEPLHD